MKKKMLLVVGFIALGSISAGFVTSLTTPTQYIQIVDDVLYNNNDSNTAVNPGLQIDLYYQGTHCAGPAYYNEATFDPNHGVNIAHMGQGYGCSNGADTIVITPRDGQDAKDRASIFYSNAVTLPLNTAAVGSIVVVTQATSPGNPPVAGAGIIAATSNPLMSK